MRIDNFRLSFDTTDMSQTACTSVAIHLDSLWLCSIQVKVTGSPVGTLKVQASNDGSTWDDVQGSTASVSGAATTMYVISDVSYQQARVVYTKTSGTGTISAVVNGKGE